MSGEYRFDPKFDWWTKDHHENYAALAEYCDKYGGGLRFLEIGVFEGRSTIWFVENILKKHKNGTYDLVEPDPAPNFKQNIDLLQQRVPHVNLIHHKNYSEHILPTMLAHHQEFDFIYIDGDHNAQGVLQDAVMSWRLLKIGGVLLFDDYEMEATDPWHYISHKEFQDHPRLKFQHPKVAIDAFTTIYRGMYEVFFHNYQVGLKKVADLGGKNLFHGIDQKDFEYHAQR